MKAFEVCDDHIMLGSMRVDVPEGYHLKNWADLVEGETVFILGTHDGNPKLYGPHKIHSVENRDCINSRGEVFKEPLGGLVVKDTQ